MYSRNRYWLWGGILGAVIGIAGYIILSNCISSFSNLTSLTCGVSVLGIPFIFVSVSMSSVWGMIFGSTSSYIVFIKAADFIIALFIYILLCAFLGWVYGRIRYGKNDNNDIIVVPYDRY